MRNRRWNRNGSPGAGSDPPNGNGHIIDLRDLVKTYETGAGGLTVLQGVTLRVQTASSSVWWGRLAPASRRF